MVARPGQLAAMLTKKMLKTSFPLDVPGRYHGKWCPEEDSNLHGLATAST
jgi:hypothetical protein